MQVSTLTRLQTLKIDLLDSERHIPSSGFGALAPLAPTLRRLSLGSCNVPNTLSTLTRLEFLGMDSVKQEQSHALDAALQHLRHLTDLRIISCTSAPPTSLTALTLLRTLTLGPWSDGDYYLLPDGEWLAGLRHLAIPDHMAFFSRRVLQQARSLEVLAVGDNSSDRFGARLVEWFVHQHLEKLWHPALHVLGGEVQRTNPHVAARLLDAVRLFPHLPLHLEVHSPSQSYPLLTWF